MRSAIGCRLYGTIPMSDKTTDRWKCCCYSWSLQLFCVSWYADTAERSGDKYRRLIPYILWLQISHLCRRSRTGTKGMQRGAPFRPNNQSLYIPEFDWLCSQSRKSATTSARWAKLPMYVRWCSSASIELRFVFHLCQWSGAWVQLRIRIGI